MRFFGPRGAQCLPSSVKFGVAWYARVPTPQGRGNLPRYSWRNRSRQHILHRYFWDLMPDWYNNIIAFSWFSAPFVLTKCCLQVCFQVLIMHQIRWRPGLHPGPRWGSLRPAGKWGYGHADGVAMLMFSSLCFCLLDASSSLDTQWRMPPVLSVIRRRIIRYLVGAYWQCTEASQTPEEERELQLLGVSRCEPPQPPTAAVYDQIERMYSVLTTLINTVIGCIIFIAILIGCILYLLIN